MKNTLLPLFAFVILLLCKVSTTYAQPCLVDSQYAASGIFPSDTLQDMQVGVFTNQVVQFVFPSDTTIFGQPLPFDSFALAQVTGMPNGLNWQCNANHPVCHYVTTQGQRTRGCVLIDGTPTAPSPAFPGYDSIIVSGIAYVTIFGTPQSFASDIPIYYRIENDTLGVGSAFANSALNVSPVPVTGIARVTYQLSSEATVKVCVVDLMGREVVVLAEGRQSQGEQELTLQAKAITNGIYLLKLIINDGEFVETKKFTSTH
jgi:hypothetical protein